MWLGSGGGSKISLASDVFGNVVLGRNASLRFLYWLRLCKADNALLRNLAKIMRMRYSRRSGLQIPESAEIGPGLFLPHALSIVVHYNASIGKNCTLHQFVTIGGDLSGNAPVIGDNCFIGSGAAILGKVRIGDNVTIGANAVVVKDVPDNATVVGVPARVIHFDHPGKYIKYPVK